MQAYESANRRAEINGDRLTLYRITGIVRRSYVAFWATTIADNRKRTRAARLWANAGKISRVVQ